MTILLLFAVLGLGSGALIAGLALAVVLTYRGSGIINLSVGAVAMLAGYAFWALNSGEHGPHLGVWPALAGALIAAALIGVLTELLAFRPLRHASPVAKLASSLGILLAAQAGMLLIFSDVSRPLPTLLLSAPVPVLGTAVPADRFLLAGIVVTLTVVLAAVYRWTRFGLASRAAAENETTAQLAGLAPGELSMVNTVLSSLLAGLMGVLSAPISQLDSQTLPLQIVPALAAALFARFTSFAVACAAGLGIGVAQSLVTYVAGLDWFPKADGIALPGVAQLLVFLIMMVAMFWRGAAIPGRGDVQERALPAVPVPQRPVRTTLALVAGASAGLVLLPYDYRQGLTNTVIGVVMVLSVIVVTGYVGQISVVQLALSGVAGFALSHLAQDAGITFPIAPIIAVAVATALGLLAAVASLRVRGVSLAVITLAAAVAMEQFIFANPDWGAGQGAPVPSPTLFGINLGTDSAFRGLDGKQPSPVFGLLALAVAAMIGLYVACLRTSTLGKRMLAVRANERAAAAAGIDVRAVKLTGYALSSAIAGIAGTLYAYNFGSVSSSRFSALAALGLIGFAYIGGITAVGGAVFAGLFGTEALIPHAMEDWLGVSGTWALLIGGISLVATLIANPDGIAGARRHASEVKR